MIELDEKYAQDLNDLFEYADSLPMMMKFSVGHYTMDVLGNQTKISYTYYMSLKLLAQRLMRKYDAKWLLIDEMGDMWASWETRAFLDQGGFVTLLNKEKQKWADAHPLADKFRTGAITALFSLIVGIALWLLANQKQIQVNTQQEKRMNSLSDSIRNLQEYMGSKQ